VPIAQHPQPGKTTWRTVMAYDMAAEILAQGFARGTWQVGQDVRVIGFVKSETRKRRDGTPYDYEYVNVATPRSPLLPVKEKKRPPNHAR